MHSYWLTIPVMIGWLVLNILTYWQMNVLEHILGDVWTYLFIPIILIVMHITRTAVSGYENGNFLRPSILANVSPDSEVAATEIFGPVLATHSVKTLDEAIDLVNQRQYGNMACIFTSSGGAARKFRYEAQAGNIGVNIGVAAPMAFFPFSGWKDSFFGTLHGQSRHAVEFYTQTKVVIERWLKEWSRKF